MAKFLPDTDPMKAQAKASAQGWLNSWSQGTNGHAFSKDGLAIASALAPWGNARYAATTAFGALIYDSYFNVTTYNAFAKGQIDYLLGNNSKNFSYLIGYSSQFPKKPHHATGEGMWDGNNDVSFAGDNRHVLYGGLVGGPKDTNDTYTDDRNDYIANEVALDYNAGFVGALAGLYTQFGGTPLPASQFPPTRVLENPPKDEFFVNGGVQSSSIDNTHSSIQVDLLATNHSAWPARTTNNLKIKYFLNLADKPSNGNVSVNVFSTDPRAVVSGLKLFDAASQIYYVEVWFKNIPIYPGGDDRQISSKETQLQFQFSWPHDFTKDWSYQQLGSQGQLKEAPNVPIYEVVNNTDLLLFGTEPTNVPQGNLTINFAANTPTECNGAKDVLNIGSTDHPSLTVGTNLVYSMAAGGPYPVSLNSATTPIIVTGGTCKGALSANQVNVPGTLSVSYIFTATPPPDTGTLKVAASNQSDPNCNSAQDSLFLDGASTGTTFTVSNGLSQTLNTGTHQLRLASQASIPAGGSQPGTCSSTLDQSTVTITKNTITTVTATYQFKATSPTDTGTIKVSASAQSDPKCLSATDTLFLDGSANGTSFMVSNGDSETVLIGTHQVKLASQTSIPAGGGQDGTCSSTLDQSSVTVTKNQTSAVAATYTFKASPQGGTCTITLSKVIQQSDWGPIVGIVNTFQISLNLKGLPTDPSGRILLQGNFVMKNNFIQNFWGNFSMTPTINQNVGSFKGEAWQSQMPISLSGFIGNAIPLKVGDNPLNTISINGILCQ